MFRMSHNTAAAGATNDVPSFPEPTAKEAMFFYHIITSNKGKLEASLLYIITYSPGDWDNTDFYKVDWNEVARKGGYANGSTASVRYGQIKRRLGLSEGATPIKSRAKKEVGSGTNTTPSKVIKKRTPKKTSKATDADLFKMADEDDEDFKNDSKGGIKVESKGYGDDFEGGDHFDDQDEDDSHEHFD